MADSGVGDDLVRDALVGKFPGGEGGALGSRPGFGTVDVELAAVGLGGVKGSGCGADVHEGKPAGVAVGQNTHFVPDEWHAVFADGTAVLDVFVGEPVGGIESDGLFLGYGAAVGHVEPDGVHGVDGVDG